MDELRTFLNSLTPISDKEFEESVAYFTKVNLQKGEYFVEQDKVCRNIAFIVSGTLRSYYINEKYEETTSCFCIEGSLTTSYKSFILQEPSNLIIQAIEDAHLLVIGYDNLQKLYAHSSAWQMIGRSVAEREFIIMEQYASTLSNNTAKEKYMRLLKEQPRVLQVAKVEDIASYLGVTRRTLSRIRKEITKSY